MILVKEQWKSKIQATISKIKTNFQIFEKPLDFSQDLNILLREHSQQLKVLEVMLNSCYNNKSMLYLKQKKNHISVYNNKT